MPKCLRLDPSFIVVAWEPQTTLDSLSELCVRHLEKFTPTLVPQLDEL